MTDYKRMVSYMYQYENGVKKKNVGFARIEAKEGQCKITLHMQLLGQLDSIFPTYLIQRKEEGIELIYLGDTILKNQVMDSKLTADEGNIMNSGYGLSDMGGMLLFLNDGVFFATEWDNKPINEDDVIEALKPKPKEEHKLTLAEEILIPKYKLPRGYKIIERLQTPEDFAPAPTIDFAKLAYDADQKLQEERLQERTQAVLSEAVQLRAVPSEAALSEAALSKAALSKAAQGVSDMVTEEQLTEDQTEYEQSKYDPAENKQAEFGPPEYEYINAGQTEYERAIYEGLQQEGQNQEQQSRGQQNWEQQNWEQQNWEQQNWEQQNQDLRNSVQQDQTDAGQGQAETVDPQAVTNIFDKFPRIYPFEDNEILICAKIEPKDIGMLPKELWVLSNNSFLVHGYYCYHHLIFAKLKDRYGCRYILGVPGIYHNRERFMARMFGFDGFKPIRKRELRQGDFGYWYMPVRF